MDKDVKVSFEIRDTDPTGAEEGKLRAYFKAGFLEVPDAGVAHMEGLLMDGFLAPLNQIAQGQ